MFGSLYGVGGLLSYYLGCIGHSSWQYSSRANNLLDGGVASNPNVLHPSLNHQLSHNIHQSQHHVPQPVMCLLQGRTRLLCWAGLCVVECCCCTYVSVSYHTPMGWCVRLWC